MAAKKKYIKDPVMRERMRTWNSFIKLSKGAVIVTAVILGGMAITLL